MKKCSRIMALLACTAALRVSGPCLIADGVSYLELHDLARLLGLYYGG